jgi:hypothetical protein
MKKQYKTASEVMEALLEGKKLRKEDWDPQVYVTLSKEKYLVDQDNDNTSIMLSDEECYEEYFAWDWIAGDKFSYGDESYEVLYADREVVFCKNLQFKSGKPINYDDYSEHSAFYKKFHNGHMVRVK